MRGNGARSGGATSGTYLPAGPVVGMLTSLPTFLDVVLASRLILVSQVVAAESGPATEGGLQLKKYGVSSLPFLVVGCHVVADGRRVSGLRGCGKKWVCSVRARGTPGLDQGGWKDQGCAGGHSSAGGRVVNDVAMCSRSCLPVKGRGAGKGCLPCTVARGVAEDENRLSSAMFWGRT